MNNLAIHELTVRLGNRTVLNQCSVTFPAGRRTVLSGPSGAGKSTLLNAIAGLVTPDAGTIRLGDSVLFSAADGVDVRPDRRRVGYVFQDLALWPHLTALQQVRLVGNAAGLGTDGATRLLQSVGLGALAHSRPGQLSGGEQQRLAIARSIAGKPAVLLLDEPFSSVDRETRLRLYELLDRVSAQVSGPTIYVSHNAEDVERLAEHSVALHAGRPSG